VRHHYIRYDRNWSKAAVRRWIRTVGLEHVPSLITLARADISGKGSARTPLEPGLIDELEDLVETMKVTEVIPTSTRVLMVNGNDVMNHLRIPPGPKVGKILDMLLEMVTESPDLNNCEDLLRLASEIE
jgi:tRNA nucleotidyltransferase (CCA-adding enzyme)